MTCKPLPYAVYKRLRNEVDNSSALTTLPYVIATSELMYASDEASRRTQPLSQKALQRIKGCHNYCLLQISLRILGIPPHYGRLSQEMRYPQVLKSARPGAPD